MKTVEDILTVIIGAAPYALLLYLMWAYTMLPLGKWECVDAEIIDGKAECVLYGRK